MTRRDPLTDHGTTRGGKKKGRTMSLLYSVENDGSIGKPLASELAIGELPPGRRVSWLHSFPVPARWGSDKMLRYGSATATMYRKMWQNAAPEVEVEARGPARDVAVLREEAIRILGGEIIEVRPVRSWFARIGDAWREWQQEVRAGM